MTGALFQVSPVNTFILCVGMRVLMGLCCGLIFLSKAAAEPAPVNPCIRCGRCVEY